MLRMLLNKLKNQLRKQPKKLLTKLSRSRKMLRMLQKISLMPLKEEKLKLKPSIEL
jgi:hypothetical protein